LICEEPVTGSSFCVYREKIKREILIHAGGET
jgi:hypothetical protein